MSVCLSVCLSVRGLTPPWDFDQEGRQYTRRVGISCPSKGKVFEFAFDQPSGRYWPETGHHWKKTAKKGLFLEVFGTFDTLSDKLCNQNVKGKKKVMRYTLLVSFRIFGLT